MNKLTGWLMSGLFVAVVMAIVFRVGKIRNVVLGTADA